MEDKEKKTAMKEHHIFLISIIVLIILGIIGTGIYVFVQYTNKQEIPSLVVSAGTDINKLIMLEGIFKVSSNVETTQEYISKTISIEPNIEYEINTLNSKEYEIIPKNNLNSNSIYNVIYSNEQGEYKWSFQTKNVYNMTGIYPKNETMSVSPDSVIELSFSYIPNDDIDKYFEIFPKIEGAFKYDQRKIRFIPKTNFQPSAKYEITIKNGFGNKENEDVLKEDVKSIFYTEYSDYEKYPLNINNVFTFKSGNKLEIPFMYPSYSRDVTDIKLQIYKYNNENEFATGVNKQMQIVSYNSLVEISTRGLTKILDAKYFSNQIREGVGGYDKIIDIDNILEEGYYLATIQENNRTYYINIQINDLVGYVSYFDDKALVWVNNIKTNDVASNASVYRNGEVVGNTNSDGYLELNNFKRKTGNYNNECIKIEKDSQLPLYMFFNDWYNDESQYLPNDQNLNMYTFIDRDKYKQNEQVNLWGFIKHRNNIEYKNVSVELGYSDYSTILQTKQIEVDEFGSFGAVFDLAGYDDGYYYLKFYANGKIIDYKYFEIRQYNTKNYNVDARLNKNVVFAGEDLQLDVLVTLFDGTPISDTEFKFSYFYGENKKTGTFKTNLNGVATVMLDTKYKTQYSSVVYANLQIWNEGKEAEYETQYIQFILLPKKENYTLECRYDRQKDVYVFDATSYLYDKNNSQYVGEVTNRNITIRVDKYQKVQVLDYIKYNENTKTNEEVYKTVKQYIGSEDIHLSTQEGSGSVEYKNPIGSEIDGYITYTSSMPMKDNTVITNSNYTYINGLQDYNGLQYTIEYNNKTYKVGDTVNINVLKNEENITTPINILHVIKSIKGSQVIYTQNSQYSFVFTKDYGTDITLKTYVFDGIGIYCVNQYEGYVTYSLDKSELQLDVDISFDKSAYKPGEDATISITTRYKGIPVETSVNICAVDNAYLAYYSNQQDIVNSLYNYYYFNNNNDFVSHQTWGMFGGGGGDGNGGERDQFVTTAFFQNVTTNSNGKATLNIKWPDNVTSWGVLAQGISKEYTAGQVTKDISVTLPFFVTPIYEDTYLVNEEPNINIRANGVNVKNGDEVQYTVTLTLPDGTNVEKNILSNVGQYATYQLPNLLPGSYELKIYGKCKEYSDTVIHDFDVVESNLTTKQLDVLMLEKNKEIDISSNVARIYLYNTSTESIIDELLELSNLPNIRNDQIVISELARKILKELSHNIYTYTTASKFFDNGGIELISNSQKDVVLTSKILSTGYANIYKQGMSDFLQGYIDDDSIDIREKLFAFWGLSSLKQPVLMQLNELKKTISNENIFERVILGLAYADIGDFNNANEILQQIVSNITTSHIEIYEFVTILAIKLNYTGANDMYNQYLTLGRESEYTNFVKLFYVQNQILKNVNKASVTLNINGKSQVYDLKEIGLTLVDVRQNDNIVVEKIDKNVGAKIEQYRTIDKIISNNVITKEYIVNGKKTNTFNNGDIVTTRIYIDYSKLEENIQYFSIEDILPNCMAYLQQNMYETYQPNVIKSPVDINGNKLTFVVSIYNDIKPYIEYQSRVVSNGKYISDGTILKTYDNVIRDYFSAGNIEVK